jgi:hypothetical protein
VAELKLLAELVDFQLTISLDWQEASTQAAMAEMNLAAAVVVTLAAVAAEITAAVAAVLAISTLVLLPVRRRRQDLQIHQEHPLASSTLLAMTAMETQVAQHQTQRNLP